MSRCHASTNSATTVILWENLPTSTKLLPAAMMVVGMRILHTADWHLGDRLGRIDRTADLRAAVELVAVHCRDQHVEVLLVAGDLFSEMSRADSLRESIAHFQATFEPFLLGGGTILALTGNHDNEIFCQTLRLVMTLAAPATGRMGDLCPPGRLYLATDPSLVRLADKNGQQVQFLLMPYPTPARYLRDQPAQRYVTVEEKNRQLQEAFKRELRQLLQPPAFRSDLPVVLAAHIHLQTVQLPSLFRMSEQESIVFEDADLPSECAYVALGHIHQPQAVGGRSHVRYSGSIERLDLGEQRDQKSVVVVDVGPDGLLDEPRLLPLPATSIFAIEIHEPQVELPGLRERYPDAQRDLVRIDFTYTAGSDDLERILRDLDEVFPRWYERDWKETSALGPAITAEGMGHGKSFEDTVRDYLQQELINHPEAVRDAVLRRAEALLSEARA
jgi:exonuclease SbcD